MTQVFPSCVHRRNGSFPEKLHAILSNPLFSSIISWLPHGRSWKVLQPELFEKEIIPRYYRHRSLASFMRQVNGWGFHRIKQGADRNSYYHLVRHQYLADIIIFTALKRIFLNISFHNNCSTVISSRTSITM